ncbi:MAG: RNA polymerase Rpb6 [Bacteroidales bacterium]|jgi:hypothetical protein|nr:RNA polymerase Rpb6 [Bacteroidales bacterium]
MNNNKSKIDTSIQTRDLNDFSEMTGNLYETIAMLSKRSDQIAVNIKRELLKKIEDFTGEGLDNMEEIIDNQERIEITRYYEQLPKPCLIAINEYLNKQLVYKTAAEVEEERNK